MPKTTLILRKEPRLEISFNRAEFEVVDNLEKSSNGVYPYRHIESVKLDKGKLSWVFALFTATLGLIIADDIGYWKRQNPFLEIELRGNNLKIPLGNYDKQQTQMAVDMLKNKKQKNYT